MQRVWRSHVIVCVQAVTCIWHLVQIDTNSIAHLISSFANNKENRMSSTEHSPENSQGEGQVSDQGKVLWSVLHPSKCLGSFSYKVAVIEIIQSLHLKLTAVSHYQFDQYHRSLNHCLFTLRLICCYGTYLPSSIWTGSRIGGGSAGENSHGETAGGTC